MEHSYVVKEGIIENYLLHQLDEKETDDFEEHLLFCKECRDLLSETKELIAITQYMAIHSSNEKTKETIPLKKVSFYMAWIKVAAVLLLAVSSAGIIWYLIQKPSESFVRNASNPNPVKRITDSLKIDESIPLKNAGQPVLTDKNDLLSDNFREYPLYENAIKNNIRGENTDALTPAKSSNIAFGKKVFFSLKDNNRRIMLSVINNRGKSFFEDTVKMPYTLQLNLPKGLYYWEITENDEVEFVSKFYIR